MVGAFLLGYFGLREPNGRLLANSLQREEVGAVTGIRCGIWDTTFEYSCSRRYCS